MRNRALRLGRLGDVFELVVAGLDELVDHEKVSAFVIVVIVERGEIGDREHVVRYR